MAWLSRNNFTPTDAVQAVDLNNLANDIRYWGGDVNGGGWTLYNANISGVLNDPTTSVGDLIVHGPGGSPGIPGSLQRLPVGASNGLALVVDSNAPLGVSWGVAAGGLVDPTVNKGDLIVKPATGAPEALAIGTDTQLLMADSSQPLGMRWATITGFAAPGSDTNVLLNKGGLPGASPALAVNYTLGHVLIGGQSDDGSAAALQVAGQVHTTMRVRSDQFFSAKTYPSVGSLNVPDSGYGGWAYGGGSIYYYWFNTGWAAVDLSKVGTGLMDPTTTVGDMIVRGATTTRLPVGTDGQTLQADSTQVLGIKWVTPPAAGVSSVFGRTGAVLPAQNDYRASQVLNAADTTQAYSDPSWIASLAWTKILNAPAFLISPLTTKGDLIVFGATPARLQVGVDGQVLVADSTQSLGIRWGTLALGVTSISPGSLTGAVDFIAGANVTLNQAGQVITISVPNINSSTGMADPTTTTGDLIVHSQSGTTRLPVGTTGQYLIADSSQLAGVRWATLVIPPAGVTSISPGNLVGAVSLQAGTNINLSQTGQVITIGAASIGMTDPTTTQGDLIVHTSNAGTTRFAAGTSNGMVLVTDMTQPAGIRWASPGGLSAAGSDMQVQVNKAGSTGADAGLTYDYTNHNLYLNADGGNQANFLARVFSGSATNFGGVFRGYAARGSMAAPAATQAGDYPALFYGHGYDGAAWQPSAQMAFGTTVNWASNNGAGFISFSTNPGGTVLAERMRITSGGQIAIGTTTPFASAKVDISHTANHRLTLGSMDWAVTPSVGIGAVDDSNNSIEMAFWASKYYFGGGPVGIGFASPSAYILDVRSPTVNAQFLSTTNTTTAAVYVNNATSGLIMGVEGSAGAQLVTGSTPYGAVLNQNVGYSMHFATTNAVRMSISNNGSVGIGTTAYGANSLVTVAGHIRMTSSRSCLFYAGDGTDAGGLQFAGGSNTGVLVITPTDNNGTPISRNIMLGGGGAGVYNTLNVNLAVSGVVSCGPYAPTNQSQLYVKVGSNADSTGQPAGPWAAIIYNANNAANQNGLLVKNNYATSTSTIFQVGNDYVGGAFTSCLLVNGAGQVGINTVTPNAILHVRAAANQNLQIGAQSWYVSGSVGLNAANDANNGGIPLALIGSPIYMGSNVGIGFKAMNTSQAMLAVGGVYGPDAATSPLLNVHGGTQSTGTDGYEIFIASFGVLSPNISKLNISARRRTTTNDWPHNDFILSHSVDIYPRVAGSYIVLSGQGPVMIQSLTPDATGAALQTPSLSVNGVLITGSGGGGGNIAHQQVTSNSPASVSVTLATAGYWKITLSWNATFNTSTTATWGLGGVSANPASLTAGPFGAANAYVTQSWAWIVNVGANAVASMSWSSAATLNSATLTAIYLGTT